MNNAVYENIRVYCLHKTDWMELCKNYRRAAMFKVNRSVHMSAFLLADTVDRVLAK